MILVEKMRLGKRAQGSIDMLLLVGGAIVLAITAGIILKGLYNGLEPGVTRGIDDTARKIGG